jgi:hypothetical protein
VAKAKREQPADGPRVLPRRVVVHLAAGLASVDAAALLADLGACAPRLPTPEVRGGLAEGPGGRVLQFKAAGARVADSKVADAFLHASAGDVEFEAGVDAEGSPVSWVELLSRLYDGNAVAQAALAALPAGEADRSTLHVWATRRLLATYDGGDMRYHARFAVFGYPTVFSALGLAVAPAPSVAAVLFARELGKRGASAGQIEAELDKEFPEERLDVDDAPTVTAALASAVLQAAARDAGDGPFCTDGRCRLFNAHRKREVRDAMLGGKMCARHAALFGSGGRRK